MEKSICPISPVSAFSVIVDSFSGTPPKSIGRSTNFKRVEISKSANK